MKHVVARIGTKLKWILAVAQLGATTAASARLLAGGLWFLVTDSTKSSLRFREELRALGQSFSFTFEDLGDFGTLHEIFVDEAYRFPLAEEPEIIFDLGSNIGASVIYFKLQYPSARIVACEPDPYNFRQLEENVASLQNVECRQVAAWSEDGTISFFADPHRGNSSSPMQRRERQHEIEVEAITLKTLMAEVGVEQVDLLKFDIEGAEFQLMQPGALPEGIRAITGEIHEDLQQEGELERLYNTLQQYDVEERPVSATRRMVFAT